MKRKEELQKEEILALTDFAKKVRMYLPIFTSRFLLSKKRIYHIVKEVSRIFRVTVLKNS